MIELTQQWSHILLWCTKYVILNTFPSLQKALLYLHHYFYFHSYLFLDALAKQGASNSLILLEGTEGEQEGKTSAFSAI